MAFTSGKLTDPPVAGSGELIGNQNVVLSSITFEDGIKAGRFVKYDTGSVDNMDGSAAPVIAGVALRNVANAVEDGAVITADNASEVEYLRTGLVTVDVLTGDTPAPFTTVWVMNDGDANDGLAAASSESGTLEYSRATFISQVQTGVWTVELGG